MTRLTLIVAAVALTSCSVDPVNQTHQGRLEQGDSAHPRDQSFYDEYTFKAKEGWLINISMTSTDVDSYLQLRREGVDDSEFLQENDDMEAGNKNSRISVTAPATGTYKVWANTYNQGETGAYTLTISAQPGQ